VTDRPAHTDHPAARKLAVARALVVALRAAGEDLDVPRPRGAPDAVVASPRGPIGIDVDDASVDEAPAPGPVGPDAAEAALVEHLTATLRNSCRRSYGMPTFLVLDVRRTPPTVGADAPAVAAALTIPAGCRFARVFVRMSPRDGGDPALYEVRGPRPVEPTAGRGTPTPTEIPAATPRPRGAAPSWRD
jgi:hypothetical protein